MACDSGCCAPKAQDTTNSPASIHEADDTAASCAGDSCCQAGSDSDSEEGAARNTVSPLVKNTSCASATTKGQTGCSEPSSCCASSSVKDQAGCSDTPTCCKGKRSPCCDASCIARVAVRECASECNSSIAEPPNPLNYGAQRPCRRHEKSVRDRLQPLLDRFGCICRPLIALGQNTCCPPQRSGSPSCAKSPKTGPTELTVARNTQSASCSDGCCKAEVVPDKERMITMVPLCAESCCDEEIARPGTSSGQREIPQSIDLEKGLSSKEHVVLSISGMTCTGCETKLSRTLSTLPAITNLKTSLVLARAEFNLNVGITSTDEVVKYLERTTEFKCERINNQGSSIDLIYDGNMTEVVEGNWPLGVTEIKKMDQKTVRVNYDAKIVGARDLIEKGWSTPMRLAPPQADQSLQTGAKHVRHLCYMTALSIVLTIPVLVLSWAPLPNKEEKELAFSSVSLALATIIQIVVAGPFYPKALKALIFSRVIEMDLLIVLSTSAAYIFSVVAFGYLVAHIPLSTGQFFETSTLLVTLIMIGRFVAALARQKAVESISIRSLQSSTAILMVGDGEKEIDTRLLQYGDIFRVSPDTKIPTDGTILSGSSEVNESMLTGESLPVEKSKGLYVIAGSINGSGLLTVRLTRLPGENTISTIAAMVDEAKLSKPKTQEIADKIASYFVPVIVAITIVVFCIWTAVGIKVQHKSGSESVIQAITYAITVLIVSCPCAIGLAVPMVTVVGTGVAAEKGAIFKSANAIEVANKTSHVVFDKTGTLTQGKLTVACEDYPSASPSTKTLLLSLIGSSKHPVSTAVADHLKSQGIRASTVSNFKSVPGKGVEGTFAGRTLRAGNCRWLNVADDPGVLSVLSKNYTAFCFTVDGTLAAIFGLQDSLREDALPTITILQQRGISVHILSGDDDGAVRAVSSQLNIPTSNVRSRCSPADKASYIKTLLSKRKSADPSKESSEPIVTFVGDGTNDAVALTQATIGIHMNEGTDVAQSAADVVLMRPHLSGILVAMGVSRKWYHRVVFNFTWSFVYNLFAILLAAGAFVHARIPPEYAGLGELVSVLPVIAAGVALKWAKI